MKTLTLAASLALSLATLAESSSKNLFLNSHLSTLKTLFQASQSLPASSPPLVSAASLKFLLELHDGDSSCGHLCSAFIESRLRTLTGGHSVMDWDAFAAVIEHIYGDQLTDDVDMPQELHLSLSELPSEMRVMWVTVANVDSPFVEFLPAATDASAPLEWEAATSVAADVKTYTVPQKWWPVFEGSIYTATMEDLLPDSSYTYRVGGMSRTTGEIVYSDEKTFKSKPLSSSERKTTAITMADQGTFELFGFKVDEAIASYTDSDVDFVMVAGDLSYAGLSSEFKLLNISKEDEFSHVWDLLAIQNEPTASVKPWMIGVGNHERFYDWVAVSSRYQMPQSLYSCDAFSNGNIWYDYEYGNSRWISLSSEHDFSELSPQRYFAEAALSAAASARDVTPWIVVTVHKPIRCSDPGNLVSFGKDLDDLLRKHDVDILVSGHMHAYERVHPVAADGAVLLPDKRTRFGVDTYKNKEGWGPVHIVQGNSGGAQAEHWIQPQPSWSAFRCANGYVPRNVSAEVAEEGMIEIGSEGGELLLEGREGYSYQNTFGFGVMTFFNKTHMFYENRPIHGSIGADSFWIEKKAV